MPRGGEDLHSEQSAQRQELHPIHNIDLLLLLLLLLPLPLLLLLLLVLLVRLAPVARQGDLPVPARLSILSHCRHCL